MIEAGEVRVLLGPVLRRAEKKQVCIWLALNRSALVKAEVFANYYSDQGANPRLAGTGSAKSIQIGSHLHVALVVAKPVANEGSGFPLATILTYDVAIIVEGKHVKLADLGLTHGKNSIVYRSDDPGLQYPALPSFFLGDGSKSLNILHGSCRKLHGKGEDCLVLADKIISDSLLDLERRPSALFLTGDQIYADDVSKPISKYLTTLGTRLLGYDEKIHGIEKTLLEIEVDSRQDLIRKYARFTAGHAENHLLGFGEFAAMYLMAWNAENWPENLESMAGQEHQKQIKLLRQTQEGLPAVRRALANIPTYMIFDDHEITDDWNLTREWQDNVVDSACGRQVVTNGLAAYWAFQGWGNDPSKFSDAFVNRISEYFRSEGHRNPNQIKEFEEFMWNFHGWDFSAPTRPLTIFVDCRTQRDYDTFKGAPELVGEKGRISIARVAEEGNFAKGDPVVLVVPTPVLGFYLIEVLQKVVALLTSVYAFDLESWYANTAGRVRFLTFLQSVFAPKHCVFLSGDVHFAFTIQAAFAPLKHGKYDTAMSISQLNSSAIKTTSLVKIAFVSEILGRIRQLFPFKRIVRKGRIDRLRSAIDRRQPDWIEARSIIHASGSAIPPLIISDNNLGSVSIGRDFDEITHRLLVKKKGRYKIYESVIRTDNGKSSMIAKIEEEVERLTRAS